ncbi:MAG: glycosyltransferase family 4 protein [Verrucomicrobiota bacterium]
MKAIFVHDRDDLEAQTAGGVQRCSREFLAIVRAASTETALFPIERSRAASLRLRRKFHLGSYLSYQPEDYAERLRVVLRDTAATHVFLNRSELLRFAPVIRTLAPQVCVVVMSHGNQSGDDLYEIAGPQGRRTGLSRLGATWQLGLDLVAESWHRHRSIDGVCAMSVEEAALERWLGAPRTVILPRLIQPDFLEHRPIPSRVGYVGTLDHTPNRVALEEVCRAFARKGGKVDFRLVGAPQAVGEEFARRHPFVTYLGPLPEAELRSEAASWAVFLNPILWLARGASMKLAQALAWGLPVVTTQSGSRGYEWQNGDLVITPDDAPAFVDAVTELLENPARLITAREASLAAARSSPPVAALAARLAVFVPAAGSH